MDDLLFILTTYDDPDNPVETILDPCPDGWDEEIVNYERSKTYYGVFVTFSIPLKFVKNGAEIIRDQFYKNGIDATVGVEIKKLKNTTLTYYTAYTGKVDFSTFKDSDFFCECNFIDGSFASELRINEDTEYSLSFLASNIPNYHYKIYYYAGGNTQPYGVGLGAPIKDLFLVLLNKMTGDKVTDGSIPYGTRKYLFQSNYLDTLQADHAISFSNSWAATFDTARSYEFKKSFKDFFVSLDRIFGLSLGFFINSSGQQVIYIEDRDYVFAGAENTDIGDVKNIAVSLIGDMNFNNVRIGYKEQDYSDVDSYKGEECNVGSLFTVKNETTGNEIDLRSDIRADLQGIKKKVDDGDDDPEDSDLYLIETESLNKEIDETGVFEYRSCVIKGLLRNNNTGHTYDMMNPHYTPRENLIRIMPYLGSMILRENKTFEFVSGDLNQRYNEVKKDGNGWFDVEADDVTSTGYLLFKPIEITFDGKFTHELIDRLNVYKNLYITFSYLGVEYNGYIKKIGVKLAGAGTIRYTLLSNYTNDLTLLIR